MQQWQSCMPSDDGLFVEKVRNRGVYTGTQIPGLVRATVLSNSFYYGDEQKCVNF